MSDQPKVQIDGSYDTTVASWPLPGTARIVLYTARWTEGYYRLEIEVQGVVVVAHHLTAENAMAIKHGLDGVEELEQNMEQIRRALTEVRGVYQSALAEADLRRREAEELRHERNQEHQATRALIEKLEAAVLKSVNESLSAQAEVERLGTAYDAAEAEIETIRADNELLGHALAITERERDEVNAEVAGLERERDEARAEIKRLQGIIETTTMPTARLDEMQARAEKAEAKVERLRNIMNYVATKLETEESTPGREAERLRGALVEVEQLKG